MGFMEKNLTTLFIKPREEVGSDLGILKETGTLVRVIWPWVKRLFDFRARLEGKIDIDVAPGSDAVWIDLGNIPHAIHVCLKVSNFSSVFSVKLEKVTGSVMMKSRQIVWRESILLSDRVPPARFTHIYCRFKLSDSQVRLLSKFSECHDLEARIVMQLEMSSRLGVICKWMPDRDILVKSWHQPADM